MTQYLENVPNSESIINAFNNCFQDYTCESIFAHNNCLYIDSNDLKTNFTNTLLIIIERYNNGHFSENLIEGMKDDMHIKVFILKHCILRICETSVFNADYKDTYMQVINWSNPHLETIYEIFNIGKYTLIVSKKIIPLFDSLTPNIDFDDNLLKQLVTQMYGLMHFLHENHATHCDLLLDNIGYDSETNCFVAFDFDKFDIYTPEKYDQSNVEKTIAYFNRSFKFRFKSDASAFC